ncbi:MAG: hypothetical protein EZS28_047747 [Streblomastix strix]|uniref:Uncharacterized protein n=1 Tax=Streblomastix strix TaxID=222440 RepID=A0A5J4TE46_9EUKA|nr:MAG: hypothetical protein EZS28_047747 [Streblomastix strix]
MMDIDSESEEHEINPSLLEAKQNQKQIGKPGISLLHGGCWEGETEVQEVLFRHARGYSISIPNQRKYQKQLDNDHKLDIVRLQSLISESDDLNKENKYCNTYWNNPKKRNKEDEMFNSRGNYSTSKTSDFSRPPAQFVQETASNSVVPDLSQRQIGIQTLSNW